MSRAHSGKSAEYLLASELTKRGYDVSIPVVNGNYDLVVDNGKRFVRVQVKSTRTKNGNGQAYQSQILKSGNKKYDVSDVDVVAVLVEPAKVWYFIPMSLINVASVYLYPSEKRGKFDTYEEYWKIFDL